MATLVYTLEEINALRHYIEQNEYLPTVPSWPTQWKPSQETMIEAGIAQARQARDVIIEERVRTMMAAKLKVGTDGKIL